MDTIADLVADGRTHDGPLIDARERAAPYTYREFCTNVWKAGNLLGQYGAHPGSDGAVVIAPKPDTNGPAPPPSDRPSPATDRSTPNIEGTIDSADPLLAILGTTLVGACADLTPETPVGARTLVVPAGAHWQERYPATPRCSVLAYGGPPDDPGVVQFESALWSQNPTAPPERVDAETLAVRAHGETYTHGTLMAGAETVVETYGLDATSRVAVEHDWRSVETLLAGLLAPLSVGATLILGEGEVTHVVGEHERRGATQISPDTITLS